MGFYSSMLHAACHLKIIHQMGFRYLVDSIYQRLICSRSPDQFACRLALKCF